MNFIYFILFWLVRSFSANSFFVICQVSNKTKRFQRDFWIHLINIDERNLDWIARARFCVRSGIRCAFFCSSIVMSLLFAHQNNLSSFRRESHRLSIKMCVYVFFSICDVTRSIESCSNWITFARVCVSFDEFHINSIRSHHRNCTMSHQFKSIHNNISRWSQRSLCDNQFSVFIYRLGCHFRLLNTFIPCAEIEFPSTNFNSLKCFILCERRKNSISSVLLTRLILFYPHHRQIMSRCLRCKCCQQSHVAANIIIITWHMSICNCALHKSGTFFFA